MNEQTKKDIVGKAVEGIIPIGAVAGKNVDEVIIRIGDAPEAHDPKALTIKGTIETPRLWLEKRAALLDLSLCHVSVSRDAMAMQLRIREKEFDEDVINGTIELSKEMRLFDINGTKRLTNFEMARLIKMNRTCFANKSVAMELVSILQNFKAKVDKELEKADNRRGDYKILVNQTVQSNLPEAFTLRIPVINGGPIEEVLVEVDIDPGDFTCALVSPDAADRLHDLSYTLIDDEVNAIKDKFPTLVIYEQ